MRLVVLCRNCKRSSAIKGRASDRYKLSRKLGDEFDWECPKCSSTNHFSIDEVSAENGYSRLIFLLIAIAGIGVGFFLMKQYFTISTWWLIPLLIAFPVTFYAAVSKEENNKIRTFNRFKLHSNEK